MVFRKMSKGKKKSLVVVVTLLLLFQLFVPMSGLASEGKDLGEIFTFVGLTLDGDEITEGVPVEPSDGSVLLVKYSWEVTDAMEAQEGDYAEIRIPDAFLPLADVSENIEVDDGDGGKVVVGQYTLSMETSILRFTFNDQIEQDNVKDGVVGFGLAFNLDLFEENTVQQVAFEDRLNKELTVILKPQGEAAGLSKIGLPDAYEDASFITWTIDFLNTEDSEITATLSDVVPGGLGLVEDSILVYPLALGYSGRVTGGQEQADSADYSLAIPGDDGASFDLTFPTVLPYSGYRVEYRTEITDLGQTTFTNSASVVYGDATLRADATVSGLSRSNMIEKDGEVLNPREIFWTIDVNKPLNTISDAVVEDVLPAGVIIIEDSIKIVELIRQGELWVAGSAIVQDPAPTDFPISLGPLDSEARRISFKTEVQYAGDYAKLNPFENRAVLKDGDIELGDALKEVVITRDPVLRKSGSSNVSYDDKSISWTIHVNEAGHPITGAVVTDTIPEGLDLDPVKVKVFQHGSSEPLGTPDVSFDVLTRLLSVTLGDIGEDQYRIEYVTELTDFTPGKTFTNCAGLNGIGVGEGVCSTSSVQPADNRYSKAFRAIDYN